jgi:hypothetical protein
MKWSEMETSLPSAERVLPLLFGQCLVVAQRENMVLKLEIVVSGKIIL